MSPPIIQPYRLLHRILLLPYLLSVCIAKNWVSLPIHAPPSLIISESFSHQADIAIGTPPQNTSFQISIDDYLSAAVIPECDFCPSAWMYDPSYSSSFNITPERVDSINLGGARGTETVTLGGVLQDTNASIVFIDHMTSQVLNSRFIGGRLGLSPTLNTTRRSKNLPLRLYEEGQLLNPVWGLRMGGSNPRLTIGALDPTEYQGEINWVPELGDSLEIQVDAFRAYNQNVLPLQYPITASLSSQSKEIYLSPNIVYFFLNESLTGPLQEATLHEDGWFDILCNETSKFEFSVDINGVNYPVREIIEESSPVINDLGFCRVAVGPSPNFVLGIRFLRSVYIAYRFPTGDCPGYYGFAVPKGVISKTLTNQKPRTTPTDAARCLSFVTPTSTPIPTISVHEGPFQISKEKYKVYGQEEDQWVELRGVEDLPMLKTKGSVTDLFG
ncbi:hypothetical protein E1B28_006882 [Marasmius oreades]|uniref:Peptidase A1 domain-containing protein n=1 Tax=Marasmius oreades TaxID=181124 RepID=A0A9P7S266_9AGAR|nr:uncharacterized protein E1B28_006882 [Marasmius oreades]KAG7093193.1 hypothetical protein E1B28_006882 [Marasmius oreades]